MLLDWRQERVKVVEAVGPVGGSVCVFLMMALFPLFIAAVRTVQRDDVEAPQQDEDVFKANRMCRCNSKCSSSQPFSPGAGVVLGVMVFPVCCSLSALGDNQMSADAETSQSTRRLLELLLKLYL